MKIGKTLRNVFFKINFDIWDIHFEETYQVRTSEA